MDKTCFVADCNERTRGRYCTAHEREATAWIREERRLDGVGRADYDQGINLDWADWDWDSPTLPQPGA